MKHKDLKIDFRYLSGNIACLSVDSISGESVHNDINNEEAIIIFNSLVGEKENCQTVKTLLQENIELKKQLEEKQNPFKGIFAQVNDDTLLRDCGNMNAEINELKTQQKEFIEYLEKEKDRLARECSQIYEDSLGRTKLVNEDIFDEIDIILSKYREIVGENKCD